MQALTVMIYINFNIALYNKMHANNINLSLSEQEREVVASILSIQDYYQLKDHRRLIRIITNRKES